MLHMGVQGSALPPIDSMRRAVRNRKTTSMSWNEARHSHFSEP